MKYSSPPPPHTITCPSPTWYRYSVHRMTAVLELCLIWFGGGPASPALSAPACNHLSLCYVVCQHMGTLLSVACAASLAEQCPLFCATQLCLCQAAGGPLSSLFCCCWPACANRHCNRASTPCHGRSARFTMDCRARLAGNFFATMRSIVTAYQKQLLCMLCMRIHQLDALCRVCLVHCHAVVEWLHNR